MVVSLNSRLESNKEEAEDSLSDAPALNVTRVQCLGCGVWGLGFGVYGLWFRVYCLGFRVYGVGCRV